MVYIRTKQSGGEKYLYLVKSVWDSKKGTSRQETIKYLGNAANVSIDDIPEKYKSNSKIVAFLAGNTQKDMAKNQTTIKMCIHDIFEALIVGDTKKAFDIYQEYEKTSSLSNFYQDILKPIMYDMGDKWASGTLSIADEHIASNTVSKLITIIDKKKSKPKNKSKILICVPNGEEHNIGCNILQSFLTGKGYAVFNLSPSAPANTVIDFIKKHEPDVVLVSITINDNIKTGWRLVNKIQSTSVPVLVGGQALVDCKDEFPCRVVSNESLESMLRIIRSVIM